MGEFVKKTMMGYKEVPGGHSDPECTHVILAEAEYAKLLRQLSDAEQKARITKSEARTSSVCLILSTPEEILKYLKSRSSTSAAKRSGCRSGKTEGMK